MTDHNLDLVPTDALINALKARAPASIIILGRQDERSGPNASVTEWHLGGPPIVGWHLCRMMMVGLERSFVDFTPPDFRQAVKEEEGGL